MGYLNTQPYPLVFQKYMDTQEKEITAFVGLLSPIDPKCTLILLSHQNQRHRTLQQLQKYLKF